MHNTILTFALKMWVYILILCLVKSESIGASANIQTNYSSALTRSHSIYLPDACEIANHYYEAIQLTVSNTSVYTFTSESDVNIVQYIYNHSFDVFNPNANRIVYHNASVNSTQSNFTVHLQAAITYVLVVTTHQHNGFGSFAITASGVSKVNFHRINASSLAIQGVYTSGLSSNSSNFTGDSHFFGYHYETIQVNVAEDGSYTFSGNSPMNIHAYLYENKFDPLDPFTNLRTGDDYDGCNMQFKLTDYLRKAGMYILVVSTDFPNATGPFSVTTIGPNNITLKRSDASSVSVQAMYSSSLTTDSSTFARNCLVPNFYYEAIEVNVMESGNYTLRGDGRMATHGYLYQNRFNPFNLPMNRVKESDPAYSNEQFELTQHLDKNSTYILVVTTAFPNITGTFSVVVIGPNKVTLKHSDSLTISVQARYASKLTFNSSTFARESNQSNDYYYEVIEVNVDENGFYILGSDSMMVTYGYLYLMEFDPLHPYLNLFTSDHSSGCNRQFIFTSYLQKDRTYILVVTTGFPKITGTFSIMALGRNKVTLKQSAGKTTPSLSAGSTTESWTTTTSKSILIKSEIFITAIVIIFVQLIH